MACVAVTDKALDNGIWDVARAKGVFPLASELGRGEWVGDVLECGWWRWCPIGWEGWDIDGVWDIVKVLGDVGHHVMVEGKEGVGEFAFGNGKPWGVVW